MYEILLAKSKICLHVHICVGDTAQRNNNNLVPRCEGLIALWGYSSNGCMPFNRR
jgi:hypothetical protein